MSTVIWDVVNECHKTSISDVESCCLRVSCMGLHSEFKVWSELCICPCHDDVIKWKPFPRYWPFVREIHRWPVNSPHKGLWWGALVFFLICAWINGSVNNREAGDWRRHRPHYDVTAMSCPINPLSPRPNGKHLEGDIFKLVFVWKYWHFNRNFIVICSWRSNRQKGSIDSSNGLALDRGKAITSTYVNPVHWPINVSSRTPSYTAGSNETTCGNETWLYHNAFSYAY